ECRGSNPWDLLSDFERRFRPFRQIELTRNYRSSQHILEACVAVIRTCDRAVTKTIECDCPDDGDRKVFLHAEPTSQAEARWVAKSIHQIVRKHGVRPRVIDEVRQVPPEVGLRLADLVDPLTHEEMDPYGLLLRRLDEGRVVLFDTETTGLDVTRDDVIELAALRIDASSERDSLEMLLKTDRPLEEASRVHGITAEELALSGREPGEGLRQFVDWVADCVLVGHNVSY